MGVKKDVATKVALGAVTEVVRTATDAMRDLTGAMTDMADSLRRIENLLDEQTDYLVETKEVVAEQAGEAKAASSPKKSRSGKIAATSH